MESAEIKPYLGHLCLVKYGKKGQLVGTLRMENGRLHIDTRLGDYGVPLDQVTTIEPQ